MSGLMFAHHVARSAGRKHALRCTFPAIENVSRAFVSATYPLKEKHTIKVPTMGDSITEGTIVEWVASVGQMVEEDDVVALVETDKVTVDIKAEVAGVITQQFGAVDDTVDVGASLYAVDTEAEATVVAQELEKPAAKPAEPTPSNHQVVVVEATKAESSHRTPSIKFLGKEGWARILSGTGQSDPVLYSIPADYGRPEISEDEIEALVMGGANIVPDVINFSSGAEFGH